MKFLLILIAFLFIVQTLAIPTESEGFYKGYKLYRFNVRNEHDLNVLTSHLDDPKYDLDPWTEALQGQVDVLVPPQSSALIKKTLLDKVPFKIVLWDLQKLIDEEEKHTAQHSAVLSRSGKPPTAAQVFKDYQDVSVYNAFLETIPGMKRFEIGKSYLNETIYGFEFGSGDKSIVYHGGIHAREWISPATVVYISWKLATDPRAADLLQKFKFHVIPVLNVDGYRKTRSFGPFRLWRKNMQPNGKAIACVGTDINRNFGMNWGERGASPSPCSATYFGPAPFSTPEAKAISDFVLSLNGNVVSYIDFHAFSQLLMFPYGSKCDSQVKEYDDLMEASRLTTEAITAYRGKQYRYGDICNTIYKASGNSVDWMYEKGGVPYSFTIELPPAFSLIFGFMLNAKEIIPVGEETFAGVLALWSFVAEKIYQ